MPDLQKLNMNKERILSIIRLKGPSLPVQISRAINQPPLFTSAFLSELYRENKLKMSNMKVGSSPLYYIGGQEELLERFIEHLNGREREAFLLLKEKQMLEDEKQEPVIRVALRAIKDFAIPIRVRINEENKLFWKFFQIPDSEIKDIIQEILYPSKKSKKQVREEPKKKEEKPKHKKGPVKKEENQFSKSIKELLEARDIETLEIISDKKKEFTAKVRIDTLFGKQEYLLIAKDKKIISENDLSLSIQKSQFHVRQR